MPCLLRARPVPRAQPAGPHPCCRPAGACSSSMLQEHFDLPFVCSRRRGSARPRRLERGAGTPLAPRTGPAPRPGPAWHGAHPPSSVPSALPPPGRPSAAAGPGASPVGAAQAGAGLRISPRRQGLGLCCAGLDWTGLGEVGGWGPQRSCSWEDAGPGPQGRAGGRGPAGHRGRGRRPAVGAGLCAALRGPPPAPPGAALSPGSGHLSRAPQAGPGRAGGLEPSPGRARGARGRGCRQCCSCGCGCSVTAAAGSTSPHVRREPWPWSRSRSRRVLPQSRPCVQRQAAGSLPWGGPGPGAPMGRGAAPSGAGLASVQARAAPGAPGGWRQLAGPGRPTRRGPRPTLPRPPHPSKGAGQDRRSPPAAPEPGPAPRLRPGALPPGAGRGASSLAGAGGRGGNW